MSAWQRGRASILAALGSIACGQDGLRELPSLPSPPSASDEIQGEPLQPLPAPREQAHERVRLGESLFSEPSISSNGKVSCATCHPLDRAGTDGLAHSRGASGKEAALNTPTIFNAGNNFRYNWNGAYASLEDEFDAPVKMTMGMTWPSLVARVKSIPSLAAGFAGAYDDGVSTANVKDALAAYIRTLATPNSRFDAFLRGDVDALSADERAGYALFEELGCSSCHQGSNIGGNLFQRFGVMRDYFADRGGPPPSGAELGRYNVTQDPADHFVFRVPSLRNVARTAPYFHDGSTSTLEEAVDTMGSVQLGLDLTTRQIHLLVTFLQSLTGEFNGRPL